MNVKRTFFIAALPLLFLVGFNLTTNDMSEKFTKNVLGTELKSCCQDPMTGFYRDGFCTTGAQDHGVHIVCAVVTDDFLKYTKTLGNDLSTPAPQYSFPGLKAGDKWCLCVSRWLEAEDAGHAPKIDLEATHEKALDFVNLKILKEYAK